MKLGFYYHIPVFEYNGRILVTSVLGVFLKHLAQNVEELVLFLNRDLKFDPIEYDMELFESNIRWVDLGVKKKAWQRMFYHKKYLSPFRSDLNSVDILLVRAPSPFAPYIHNYLDRTMLAFLIVGSYKDGAEAMTVSSIRDIGIKLFLKFNQKKLERAVCKDAIVLVNSEALQRKYRILGVNSYLIKTTTITIEDLYEREDSCQGDAIHLLFTGRIDLAKGLLELVEAAGILRRNNINIFLNIVGSESGSLNQSTEILIKAANLNKLGDRLIFHGKKSVGRELNHFYRMADIFVLPSHHEGFPRTIWEAFANSIPVIASRVGGIPYYLTHEKNAILIEPKSVNAIVNSVLCLVENNTLRKTIIKGGFQLALDSLIEYQTKRAVEHLKGYVE